ncbi:putative gpr1 fun34 -class plasma membrane protein [Lasiodiplodia theobromae]|nr:putative gpr1 fun34 -class plasma membrane protein [Lasiodiplodia theobromae]
MTSENPYAVASADPDAPLEKDFTHSQNNLQSERLEPHVGSDEALRRIRTAGSISISPELFEKMYLSPQNQVKGDLRKMVGNPTPLALVGFLLSLSPLSCILMGWRGSGGSGASGTATYFFFGGILMLLGAVGEWILGNTYPFVVFGTFGAFWLSFGGTLQPDFNAYGAYSPDPSNPAAGLTTVGFNSSFAFFLLFMGLLSFLFLILALRTNIVFVVIFATLSPAFCLLAGAYWQTSNGNTDLASNLMVAAGACTFVTCAGGWWIFFAIMLAALDFPFQLPVGDLSTLIKGATQRQKELESQV